MNRLTSVVKNERVREVWFVVLLVLITLSIRVFFLQFRNVIETDSYFYLTCGRNLIEGKGFVNMDGTPHLTWPPLTSFLIGVIWLFVRDLEFAGRLLSICAGSLLVIPFYYLAKKIRDQKTAILSSIFVAFYPGLINISTQVGSDSLYILLLAGFVTLLWFVLNNAIYNWRYFILIGFLLGLCYLARAVGFFYFFVALIWMFLYFVHHRSRRIQLIINISVFLVSFLISISPYLTFVYKHTGRISLSPDAGSWLNMDVRESDEQMEITKKSLTPPTRLQTENRYSLVGYFVKYPKEFFLRFIECNFIYYRRVVPKELTPLIILFLGLGIFGVPFRKERFKGDIFLLSLLLPIAPQVLWNLEPRYLIPIMPYMLIFTSSGLFVLREQFLNPQLIGSSTRKKIFIFLVVLIILSFLPSAFNSIINVNEGTIEHKKAGLWLGELDQTAPLVMARKPYVSFYSDSRWICLPFGSYEETIAYARKNKVKYLVIDEVSIPKLRPQLNFLLNEKKVLAADLSLIYKDNSNGRLILIYKVKPL